LLRFARNDGENSGIYDIVIKYKIAMEAMN